MKRILFAAIVLGGVAASCGAGEWQLMWTEQLSGQNIYYGGGVYDGVYYTGQIYSGPQTWGKQQVGDTEPTALLNSYADEGGIGAKSSCPMGDYIFMGDGNGSGGVARIDNDWESNPTGRVLPTGRQVVLDSITTDGTYLYTDEYAVQASGATVNRALLHKWEVTNQVDSFTLTEVSSGGWSGGANTGATGRIRAVSYYDDGGAGRLYCGDHDDTTQAGDRIFEVNATTGSVKTLGIHEAGGVYQVVRYGDSLFVTDDVSDYITIYDISGGALGANPEIVDPGLGDLYGIGVDGDGSQATGFWVSSINAHISYFAFDAFEGDLNGDGFVNSGDLDIVRANWGTSGAPGIPGDATGDGAVNSSDLDVVRANWGRTASAAVPEPSAIALALAALGILLLRRK